MMVVSKYNPLMQYQWGNNCEGWNLVDETSLSIKLEKMPAGTSEARHYHRRAQQFFYILKGKATFELENKTIEVSVGKGIHIAAATIHWIFNDTTEDLEFILCSQPTTIHDRINCG